MQTTLAELLLRRKELNRLYAVRVAASSYTRDTVRRVKVTDEYDQVDGRLSRIDKAALEKETNYYAHQRRMVDSVIQQTNWVTEVTVPSMVMMDDLSSCDGRTTAKLAELLVRRKEVESQLARNDPHNSSTDDLYTLVSTRIPVSAGLSEITDKHVRFSPCTLDSYALNDLREMRLREIDTAIQRCNWATYVEVDDKAFRNYVE